VATQQVDNEPQLYLLLSKLRKRKVREGVSTDVALYRVTLSFDCPERRFAGFLRPMPVAMIRRNQRKGFNRMGAERTFGR
jgi:predicted component of viral defense system (DUF524 family)